MKKREKIEKKLKKEKKGEEKAPCAGTLKGSPDDRDGGRLGRGRLGFVEV